jgi:DNA-binding transcriptional MerR regulator
MSEYVSSSEAGKILDCSPDYVRLMARTGRLVPAIETKAGRLFRRSDVEALARRRFVEHAETPVAG